MEIMNENNTADFSSFSVLLSSSTIASSFEISLTKSFRNTKQKKMFANTKKLRATKKMWSTSSPCTHKTSNKSLKKLFSFKSKLSKSKKLKTKQNAESCCASIMLYDSIYTANQKVELDWSLGNELGEKKCDNQEPVISNLLKATICKLMDKPLGWFKQKSQKRKTNKAAKKNSNSNETEWTNPNFISQISDDYESTAQTNFTHLIELEGKQINLRMQSLAFMNANYYSSNSRLLKNHSLMISAPSMSSSFDENKQLILHHSTPQSLCQQFSPILSIKKSSDLDGTKSSCISSTSFVSSHSTPITSSSSCSRLSNMMTGRRLSFGVTSSPVPFDNESNYFDNNIYYGNDELTDSNYESQNEFELNNGNVAINNKQTSNQFSVNTSVLSVSEQEEQQKKLMDHIDNIRRNVRLGGVKMRLNLNFKKEESIVDADEQEAKTNHKSKRLQKMFRAKLRKQLKEMKKWQAKAKQSDIENVVKTVNDDDDDDDEQSMSENNNSINCSTSSHNYYFFDRPNFYECKCQLSHHQRFHNQHYEENKNGLNSFLLYENANANYENQENLIFRNNFYDICH